MYKPLRDINFSIALLESTTSTAAAAGFEEIWGMDGMGHNVRVRKQLSFHFETEVVMKD